MKYSFGVPAWLGGLKVALVVFGIPGVVAGLGGAALTRRLELTGWSKLGLSLGVVIVTFAVWMFTLIAWSRWASKRKDRGNS